jgi:hypothetical protein
LYILILSVLMTHDIIYDFKCSYYKEFLYKYLSDYIFRFHEILDVKYGTQKKWSLLLVC